MPSNGFIINPRMSHRLKKSTIYIYFANNNFNIHVENIYATIKEKKTCRKNI